MVCGYADAHHAPVCDTLPSTKIGTVPHLALYAYSKLYRQARAVNRARAIICVREILLSKGFCRLTIASEIFVPYCDRVHKVQCTMYDVRTLCVYIL